MKLPRWISSKIIKINETGILTSISFDKESLMQDWMISLLIPIIERMINAVSPQIRQMLSDFLIKLWEETEKTSNPWDNIVVGLLMSLVGLSTPKKGE
jgi:hypothetical protein